MRFLIKDKYLLTKDRIVLIEIFAASHIYQIGLTVTDKLARIFKEEACSIVATSYHLYLSVLLAYLFERKALTCFGIV